MLVIVPPTTVTSKVAPVPPTGATVVVTPVYVPSLTRSVGFNVLVKSNTLEYFFPDWEMLEAVTLLIIAPGVSAAHSPDF